MLISLLVRSFRSLYWQVIILLKLLAAFITVNHWILLSFLISQVTWRWHLPHADSPLLSHSAQWWSLCLFALCAYSLGEVISSHGFSYHCCTDDTHLVLSFPPSDTSQHIWQIPCHVQQLIHLKSQHNWAAVHPLELCPHVKMFMDNSLISLSVTALVGTFKEPL